MLSFSWAWTADPWTKFCSGAGEGVTWVAGTDPLGTTDRVPGLTGG